MLEGGGASMSDDGEILISDLLYYNGYTKNYGFIDHAGKKLLLLSNKDSDTFDCYDFEKQELVTITNNSNPYYIDGQSVKSLFIIPTKIENNKIKSHSTDYDDIDYTYAQVKYGINAPETFKNGLCKNSMIELEKKGTIVCLDEWDNEKGGFVKKSNGGIICDDTTDIIIKLNDTDIKLKYEFKPFFINETINKEKDKQRKDDVFDVDTRNNALNDEVRIKVLSGTIDKMIKINNNEWAYEVKVKNIQEDFKQSKNFTYISDTNLYIIPHSEINT